MNEEINKRLNKLDGEISALRRMLETKPQRRQTWSQFEKEVVADKLNDAVCDLNMKMDHTKTSVKWEIYRQLRDQLL